MRDWPAVPARRFRRAVFLDRDGTLIVDRGYTHNVEDLEFLPNAVDGLVLLATLPLHVIIATNQAGISLGYFSQDQMSAFNRELITRVDSAGGRIDGVYYCPDLEGKHLTPQAKPSECVKPNPGMLLEASRDFDLDLKQCFMVGDKTSDIAAGQRGGCMTIKVQSSIPDAENIVPSPIPDESVEDLLAAAQLIKRRLSGGLDSISGR